MTDYSKLYRENEQFKIYVNKCAKANGETVEQTLTRLVVRNVGDYYIEMGVVKHPTTTVTCGGGCG